MCMIKVGDLIKVAGCSLEKDSCECFFCADSSSRVGLVVCETFHGGQHAGWNVLFDCGEWEVYPSDVRHGDVKVISENR